MKPGRFDYVKYDEQAQTTQEAFKLQFTDVENHINQMLVNPRYKALALTKLEECYMFIGKAIRDDQIERTGKVELQEDRDPAADGKKEERPYELVAFKEVLKGCYAADVDRYKAPEQVEGAMRAINKEFGVHLTHDTYAFTGAATLKVRTEDRVKLAAIEMFLLDQKIIKRF